MANYVSSLGLLLLLLLSGIAISSNTNCEVIPRLFAREPSTYIPRVTGSIEIWDPNTDYFQCAGVRVARYTIQPYRGSFPIHTNADRLNYIIQGNMIFGLTTPECYKKLDGEKNECHKILRVHSGDVFYFRAGETFLVNNDGNETLIIIAISRIPNSDPIRTFYLGGLTNILDGFSSKFITKAFNVNHELATKLQKQIDLRGSTVSMTGGGLYLSSSLITPPCPKQERKGPYNVNDESFSNINTRIAKTSDPSRADLFIQKVGHLTTIDVHQLPILESSQLSVTYNLLLKDVMRLPHWENCHSIIYMVKGEGYIQVVDDNGKNVFDDIVKKGQLLLVPHSFLMTEQAKSERFEYVTFKTNGNPTTSELTGRNSVINCLPLEVLVNAFEINKEEAKKVKLGRNETSLVKIIP
ncbi:11S globulin seed storage protein Ana o 2.0101-like isoform X2 [Euphorbia lathyris]|uniref:11S globulin seed storage protein Ana o 2.0101-like isoform X2 n=1 Tax=Euphorbia lathyris TaxID=212925 RepID=UPI00331339B5